MLVKWTQNQAFLLLKFKQIKKILLLPVRLFSSVFGILVVVLLSGILFHTPKSHPKKVAGNEETIINSGKIQPHYTKRQFTSLLNNRLPDYLAISSTQGIEPQENHHDFERLAKIGALIPIETNPLFLLDSLRFSYPYLVPYAERFLMEVASAFHDSVQHSPLEKHKIVVTSLIRTRETVSRLVKRNRSATEQSPHLNGNSIDFSFKRFGASKELNEEELIFLQETLSGILWNRRERGDCWVTYEPRQACLHVVVRDVRRYTFAGKERVFR